MGVPVVAQCVADPKPLAQTWAMRSRSTLFQHTRCYFNTVEDMANRQGKCLFHPRMSCCKLPSISFPDIVVAGLPCKPFSLQRGDRSKTLPQDHESFQVVLAFLRYLDTSGAQGGVVEEVLGFGFKLSPQRWRPTSFCMTMPESWAVWFKSQLEARGYKVRVLRLNNDFFSDVPRTRTVTS